MNQQTREIIKQTVLEFLTKMGFSVQLEITDETGEDENIVCNIQTKDDSNFLIGQHGLNLQAMQHIARLLVRKKTSEKIHFVLDVNSYRQNKNQSIIEAARQAAEEAIMEKRSVIMKPMSTYERRLVHIEIAKNEAVITESIGEGESRKIVIKPASEI